jgi:hypothetical protein
LTTANDEKSLPFSSQITKKLTGLFVFDECSQRYRQDELFASPARLPRAFTVTTALSVVVGTVPIASESVLGRVGHEPDRSAVAAPAAVGATSGNELLPTKADDAVTTLARSKLEDRFVDPHGPIMSAEVALRKTTRA